jgi:DNA-binding winged helix-turn-helix (wHTH) protein
LDSTATRVRFGAFVFDRETRQLRRGDSPQRLKPQAFDLLDLLIARAGPPRSRSGRSATASGRDTFVAESTLSSLAAQVRRALGRDGAKAVRTVHGFGYAFEAEATEDKAGRGRFSIAAHLTWNRRTIVLVGGENVIGRDADVEVRIEAPGVSRRHARILAEGGRFVLEDLESKNGTYLRGVRLSPSAELTDGDEFRLGQTLLVFRVRREAAPTATEPRP